ncbi:unnamed protein product [Paramecium sonneborni]|uniref:Uncharacterized protein n=1 Tax=Paramecium sonneborni TaxID=65129 RepID=A0A8S1RHN8_9CILI|nr:unnamed protein product [Paramecium sonneborni]
MVLIKVIKNEKPSYLNRFIQLHIMIQMLYINYKGLTIEPRNGMLIYITIIRFKKKIYSYFCSDLHEFHNELDLKIQLTMQNCLIIYSLDHQNYSQKGWIVDTIRN